MVDHGDCDHCMEAIVARKLGGRWMKRVKGVAGLVATACLVPLGSVCRGTVLHYSLGEALEV